MNKKFYVVSPKPTLIYRIHYLNVLDRTFVKNNYNKCFLAEYKITRDGNYYSIYNYDNSSKTVSDNPIGLLPECNLYFYNNGL